MSGASWASTIARLMHLARPSCPAGHAFACAEIRFLNDSSWVVPYYVDVGTGESKFTWQANAGVGYCFDWGALVASWRYLSYDFKSGGHIDSLSFSGPLIGVAFKF